jgi:hypothetical protein
MICEVDGDVAATKLYMSVRFSPKGMAAYEGLLRLAIEKHSDSWLANQFRNGCMELHEMRKKPKGGVTMALVPVTAADTFAEGEFNRFYARAVCSRAIADGIPHVVVYRGKEVVTPRPASTALIGAKSPRRAYFSISGRHRALSQDWGYRLGQTPALRSNCCRMDISYRRA